MPAPTHSMRITSITMLTPDIKLFQLSPTAGALFTFTAGQFCMLHFSDPTKKGAIIKRSYSIASSPNEQFLELCIKIKQDGTSGPLLAQFKEGTTITVEGPYGRFLLDQNSPRNIFLVGSGSGIAPLVSMMRTLRTIKRHAILIYGFRYAEDYAYGDELSKMDDMTILPVASHPKQPWPHATGHVQDVIKTLAEQSFRGSDWYLCGPPAMVRDVKQMLLAKQVSETSIKTEMYE